MHKLGYAYWTVTHSFAVIMGAIVVKPPDSEPTPVYVGVFEELAREGLASRPIEGKEIRDRSKSSNIVKTATCLQVSWLVLQCIGR